MCREGVRCREPDRDVQRQTERERGAEPERCREGERCRERDRGVQRQREREALGMCSIRGGRVFGGVLASKKKTKTPF